MRMFVKGFFAVMLILTCKITVAQLTPSTSEFKREFLENIIHVRQKGCNCGNVRMAPAPPLVWNDQLETAAIGHAADMSNKSYFSHNSQDGRTSDQRMVAAGYGNNGFKSFAVGENIAQGQMSIAEVMAGWIKSPGHCKNLMYPEFKEVGIAKYNDY